MQPAEVRIHGAISGPTDTQEHNEEQICASSIGLNFLELGEDGLDISAKISKGGF